MTRTIATIGQRTTYPRAMRLAVLKDHKKTNTAVVARNYNVSPSTVNNWAKKANKSKPQPKQLAAHQAAAAAIKAYNTPTLVDNRGQSALTPANATHIKFRGKTYAI